VPLFFLAWIECKIPSDNDTPEHTIMKQCHASLSPFLLATALLLLGSGCTKEDAPIAPVAPPAAPVKAEPAVVLPPPVSAEALSLLDFKIARNQAGKSVLKGSVKNTSPQTIKLGTATFTLFNKKGVEIGTSVATVDNLEPGFAWTFEAQILQEGVASAKFAGFTAK
jgi:hypothetical protein